ncbi:hypothetical protein [Fibrella aquatica]|uniref:hypothetical protein n=1 Tax=Fibrella aquatica TaxID=3242487 RepID=UPI003522BDBD
MLKKKIYPLLSLTLLTALTLTSCSKKTELTPATPDNTITDAGGLNITLTYTKSPATADLDLYLYRKSSYSGTSNPQGGTIGPSDTGVLSTDIQPVSPDEELLVVAAYRTGTAAMPYTIIFKGITDKKTYTVNGSFAAGLAPFNTNNYFGTPRGNNITLKKTGNTYTITP